MKTIIITLSVVFISASIPAQVPQKMSYQAIIRNEMDSLVRNQQVGLRISIIQGTVNGAEVYKEVYNPMPVTNMNGLITVEIGMGTPVTGTFSGIDWSGGPYFIKTETDPTGNTNYSIITTSQLLSVPYALHAKTAEVLVGDVATKSYVDAVLARLEAVEKHLNISPDSVFTDIVFTDVRDGTQYKTVKIGNQIWMAENLKYLPEVSGIPEKLSETLPNYYVLNYNGTNVSEAKASENYNLYGVLYNWPAAMNGGIASNLNPSGVQGVCPAGWHLPSMHEWIQMVDYLGGEDVAAKKLMESGKIHWKGDTSATNESGFTALPGGTLIDAWGLGFWSSDAIWWTTTLPGYSTYDNGKQKFYSYPAISGYSSTFSFYGIYDWDTPLGSGFSVRCVKN
jgi:uncharacterized protein (TIGR02145 family)